MYFKTSLTTQTMYLKGLFENMKVGINLIELFTILVK